MPREIDTMYLSKRGLCSLLCDAVHLGTMDEMNEARKKTGRQVLDSLGVVGCSHADRRLLLDVYGMGRRRIRKMGSAE